MLMPKRVKHRKPHRGTRGGVPLRGSQVVIRRVSVCRPLKPPG